MKALPAHLLATSALSACAGMQMPDEIADLQVKLKRDVYVYKHWASFDGKQWQPGHDIISGKLAMTLPGEGDGRSPGSLSAQFDLK